MKQPSRFFDTIEYLPLSVLGKEEREDLIDFMDAVSLPVIPGEGLCVFYSVYELWYERKNEIICL